jgi:hypothetical protein
MLGFRFVKSQPTVHLMQFRSGAVVREGAGQSFWYHAPTSTLVAVPLASQDRSFMLDLVTADFQAVTIQGQVTFRINDPRRTAAMMDFAVDADGSVPVRRAAAPGRARGLAGRGRHRAGGAGPGPEAGLARVGHHRASGRTATGRPGGDPGPGAGGAGGVGHRHQAHARHRARAGSRSARVEPEGGRRRRLPAPHGGGGEGACDPAERTRHRHRRRAEEAPDPAGAARSPCGRDAARQRTAHRADERRRGRWKRSARPSSTARRATAARWPRPKRTAWRR